VAAAVHEPVLSAPEPILSVAPILPPFERVMGAAMFDDLEFFRYRRDGRIARIVFNRPNVLNAVHSPAVRELARLVRAVEADPETRVVAISGAGRAFSTGMDLKELPNGLGDRSFHAAWEGALRGFETMDKIVVALIHGYAIGGGLQLALACDIRVATRSAGFSLPAVREGLIPGLGTLRLARFIGLGRAKRMALLGTRIYGEEAERIGLVDHLVNEDTASEEYEVILRQYLRACSTGARLSKRALITAYDMGYDDFLRYYLDLQDEATASPDHREALAALQELREPVWR
jgi:enoyl-CoA hydratase/carnithine racemase